MSYNLLTLLLLLLLLLAAGRLADEDTLPVALAAELLSQSDCLMRRSLTSDRSRGPLGESSELVDAVDTAPELTMEERLESRALEWSERGVMEVEIKEGGLTEVSICVE